MSRPQRPGTKFYNPAAASAKLKAQFSLGTMFVYIGNSEYVDSVCSRNYLGCGK